MDGCPLSARLMRTEPIWEAGEYCPIQSKGQEQTQIAHARAHREAWHCSVAGSRLRLLCPQGCWRLVECRCTCSAGSMHAKLATQWHSNRRACMLGLYLSMESRWEILRAGRGVGSSFGLSASSSATAVWTAPTGAALLASACKAVYECGTLACLKG